MQLVELCGLWPVILVYGVMIALSTAIETSEAINGGETCKSLFLYMFSYMTSLVGVLL